MNNHPTKHIPGSRNDTEALDETSTTEENNEGNNKTMEDESLKKTEDSFGSSNSSSSNAKRPGLESGKTRKKMKSSEKKEEEAKPRFTDLPDGLLSLISSFFDLEELFKYRRICKKMQRVCNNDSRWLPVIAPPTLSHKVLTVKEDGKELRRLYKEYCQWVDWWEDTELQISKAKTKKEIDTLERKFRSKVSDLDGFFSLSPWENSTTTYPTPWLHRMVYNRRCPTDDISSASTPPFRPRQRMVLRRRTTESRDPPSLFFQQRRRTRSPYHRTFYTEPIPLPGDDRYQFDRIRRVVIQPVNFLHERLPDHDDASLERCMKVCTDILECYFGPHTTRTGPVVARNVDGHHCRDDIQDRIDEDRRPVLQINSDALLDCPVLPGGVDGGSTSSLEDTAVVFLIAPHMYSGTFAWVYSTDLDDADEGVYPAADPWVVSTFIAHKHTTEEKFPVFVAHLVLDSVLKSFETLGVCENLHCVLNSCDSVEEALNSFCFVPCCACIRKLQLIGVIGKGHDDVPQFLSRLSSVLRREKLEKYSGRDLAVLDALGY